MTAAAFIDELTRLGVKLHPEGDCLRYRGPASVITPELKQRMAEQKAAILAVLTTLQTESEHPWGPGRPSPENACRPIEARRAEAKKLLAELEYLYNERAAIYEYEARLQQAEAERLALIWVRTTELYQSWRSLG
jgi:hypothetical protein